MAPRQPAIPRRGPPIMQIPLVIGPGKLVSVSAPVGTSAAAGVSVPTLYASVGSKAKIALALVEFLTEEAEIPKHDRIQQATTTGPDLIRANVHLVRVLNERFGGFIVALNAAAAAEPDLV